MSFSLGNPPAGAWYRETPNGGFVLGASTRSKTAWLVVFFTAVWSALTCFIFVYPLLNGKPVNWEMILGAVMIASSLFFIYLCIRLIFGKVEITSDGRTWTIFSGLGRKGATETVTVSRISGISQELLPAKDPNAVEQHVIVLQVHQKPLQFGVELANERREFILYSLQQILAATAQ